MPIPEDSALALEFYSGVIGEHGQVFEAFRKLIAQTLIDSVPAESRELVEKEETQLCDLLRFLVARKWDVEAAKEQWLKMVLWKISFPVYGMLDTPCPDEDVWDKIAPYKYFGHSKKGNPIYWERTGRVDVNAMIERFSEDELRRKHVRHMQELVHIIHKAQEKCETPVYQQIVVMDLAGLAMRPNTRANEIFRMTLELDQNYYPERLTALFLINAPWVFKPLWKVVKKFIDPHTATKCKVLGEDFLPQLLTLIDADQIPQHYGGTAVVPGVWP